MGSFTGAWLTNKGPYPSGEQTYFPPETISCEPALFQGHRLYWKMQEINAENLQQREFIGSLS